MIEFLIANWLWIAFLAVFVAMHRTGHGCGTHGGHRGRHASPGKTARDDSRNEADGTKLRASEPRAGSGTTR